MYDAKNKAYLPAFVKACWFPWCCRAQSATLSQIWLVAWDNQPTVLRPHHMGHMLLMKSIACLANEKTV